MGILGIVRGGRNLFARSAPHFQITAYTLQVDEGLQRVHMFVPHSSPTDRALICAPNV